MYNSLRLSIFLGVIGMSIFASTPEVGQLAPNFNLKDQDGISHNLEDYKGKKLVMYLFPKADTPGWKKQACGLRDNFSNYEKSNITILGISYDSESTLKAFKEKYSIQFNFLSDSDKVVGREYGVSWFFVTARKTFLIDEKGILVHVIDSVDINTHATDILTIYESTKKS